MWFPLFQINKDDCNPNPCQNNGECIDEVEGFHCNCTDTGYTGIMCQNNENECKFKPSPCLNGGTCYDTYGSYICECLPNYSGFNCEQLIDPCSTNPCGNGGSCINRKDSFQCICLGGFSGEVCEIGPSCGKECPKNTECIAGQCCELDSTEKKCISSKSVLDTCNCMNGGTCNGNNTCICPDEYEGPMCENDVDECILNPNICVHGICVNSPGTFKCYCEPGKFSKIFYVNKAMNFHF